MSSSCYIKLAQGICKIMTIFWKQDIHRYMYSLWKNSKTENWREVVNIAFAVFNKFSQCIDLKWKQCTDLYNLSYKEEKLNFQSYFLMGIIWHIKTTHMYSYRDVAIKRPTKALALSSDFFLFCFLLFIVTITTLIT